VGRDAIHDQTSPKFVRKEKKRKGKRKEKSIYTRKYDSSTPYHPVTVCNHPLVSVNEVCNRVKATNI
jgi:hypothetical protein